MSKGDIHENEYKDDSVNFDEYGNEYGSDGFGDAEDFEELDDSLEDEKFETAEFEDEKSETTEFGDEEFEMTEFGDEEFEDEEFDCEEEKPHAAKRKKKGSRKVWIAAGGAIAAIVVIYLCISVFFMSHFYANTEINGHDFSTKTAADVESYMKKQVKDYALKVLEMDNTSDTIRGSDIDLVYKSGSEIQDAIKKQNAFLWPAGFFSKKSTDITVNVSYDEQKLESAINGLQSVQAEQVQPISASPKFDGNQFVIEPEVLGTAVNMDALHTKITQYVSEFKAELDMEKEGCYALPKYTSGSKEVKNACDTMNAYLKANITYTMTENVVVDKSVISGWLTVDGDMNVTLNEGAVREWLAAFGDKYDTVGATRTITTPGGKTVEVSGGTYGWSIDEDTEFTALVNSIRNGETVTKEPAYYQTAASHSAQDWGNTYAEVDLSSQHMWYISNGSVALETDVVTGVPTPEKETPAGVYYILEKSLNKTLVGDIKPETGKPEYETPVDYWMRVTWSGIGFHDADWQSAFGGSRYTDGFGSHGCINMPVDMAASLYNMMPEGTPVIIHN